MPHSIFCIMTDRMLALFVGGPRAGQMMYVSSVDHPLVLSEPDHTDDPVVPINETVYRMWTYNPHGILDGDVPRWFMVVDDIAGPPGTSDDAVWLRHWYKAMNALGWG